MTRLSSDLVGKNLQILLEVVPGATRVALITSGDRNRAIVENGRQAARSRGLTLRLVNVGAPGELDAAFAALKREGVQALLVSDTGGGMFFTQRYRLVELALAQRLPAIFGNTEIVEAGGLMSYSPSSVENYRHAAAFIDKILHGAKAGDIPIEQPTTFELVVNARTAKAMDLALPGALLLRADRVIE
jgi:putative ABC transport system substrate-binding protein